MILSSMKRLKLEDILTPNYAAELFQENKISCMEYRRVLNVNNKLPFDEKIRLWYHETRDKVVGAYQKLFTNIPIFNSWG
ncbi:MAG: hypothetical protein ABIE22_00520 [archaeon]